MMPYTITQHPVCSSLLSPDHFFFSISCVLETEVTQQCNLLITKLPLTRERLLKKHNWINFGKWPLYANHIFYVRQRWKILLSSSSYFHSQWRGGRQITVQKQLDGHKLFNSALHHTRIGSMFWLRVSWLPTIRKPFGGNEVIPFQPFTFGSWSWGSFNMRVIHICTSIPTLFSWFGPEKVAIKLKWAILFELKDLRLWEEPFEVHISVPGKHWSR